MLDLMRDQRHGQNVEQQKHPDERHGAHRAEEVGCPRHGSAAVACRRPFWLLSVAKTMYVVQTRPIQFQIAANFLKLKSRKLEHLYLDTKPGMKQEWTTRAWNR